MELKIDGQTLMGTYEIKGHAVEYIDSDHIYVVDGVILPSITQILAYQFPNKYANVDSETLKKASERGTAIHKVIEKYENHGIETEDAELRNWKFIKDKYKVECVDNEVPVVLFDNEEPIACGRLDLVVKEDDKLGLADIKTTATLDKEYLAYQLNLYRLAYKQCYDREVDFLKGVHLKGDTRKYVDIPVAEEFIKEFIKEWRKENE